MKRLLLIVLGVLVIAGAAFAWLVYGPGTAFNTDSEVIYVRPEAPTEKALRDSMRVNRIVSRPSVFEKLASYMNLWSQVKPGRYEIQKGSSLITIIRKLRSGEQDPVKLIINKVRTPAEFAKLLSNRFHFDSSTVMQKFRSGGLDAYGVDTTSLLSMIIPDSYELLWTSQPDAVLKKLQKESQTFWTDERKKKAETLGLDPKQVYTLASIVEEETRNVDEKDTVASVYLNRLRKGMALGADPTVKFALRDFGLRRILNVHTQVQSPYNTYRNRGLPPGPISTASRSSLEAVLNPAQTEYLFFVASPTLAQDHIFSRTYEEHLQKAREYHQVLDEKNLGR